MQKLAQIVFCSVVIATISASAQNRQTILIDNKNGKKTGNWMSSKSSGQKYGDDYEFASTVVEEQPNFTFEYRPKIPMEGMYDIEIWYAQGDKRSTNAPWTISCKSGSTTVFVDEQKNGGRWFTIAKNQLFAEGTSGFVMTGNNTGATNQVVVADAVHFVPVEGEPGFTLNFKPTPGGHINMNPNKASFAAGTAVEITAEPDDGYVFNGWLGDTMGMDNPTKVTMDVNRFIGASFIPGGIGAIVESEEAKRHGKWMPGNKQWGKPHSDIYYFTPSAKGDETASSTFTPDLPKTGMYDVFVWYVPGTNRCENAPFEISCKSGKSIVKVNQKIGGNDWMPLTSDLEFEKGTSGYVKLSNAAGEHGMMVVADAVAFLYTGPSSSTPPVKR